MPVSQPRQISRRQALLGSILLAVVIILIAAALGSKSTAKPQAEPDRGTIMKPSVVKKSTVPVPGAETAGPPTPKQANQDRSRPPDAVKQAAPKKKQVAAKPAKAKKAVAKPKVHKQPKKKAVKKPKAKPAPKPVAPKIEPTPQPVVVEPQPSPAPTPVAVAPSPAPVRPKPAPKPKKPVKTIGLPGVPQVQLPPPPSG